MRSRPFLVLVLCFGFLTCLARATDIPLTQDAHVNSATPTVNYGAVSNLYVGNNNTAYVQFDTTQLPAGTTSGQIAKATLLVFVNRVNTSAAVNVNLLTSSWAEGTVTYNTAPTAGASVGSFTPATAGVYVPVDVTTAVKGWVTTPASNYGLAFTSASGNVLFDSKENDQTAHPAKLDVTLASGGFTAGTAAGQVYLTGASGAVPTTPVSVSGDITLASSGVVAINTGASSTAGADIVSAVNASAAGATFSSSRLGANSGSSTTFLNGNGGFAAPITLTTTGASGAATLTGNTLNIPTPAASGSSFTFSYSTINGGSVQYCPANAGSSICSTTLNSGNGAYAGSVAPVACTVKLFTLAGNNFYNAGANTIMYKVLQNGNATAMGCSVIVPQGGRASCSDATHTFAVTAGDLLTIEEVSDSNGNSFVATTAVLVCQ